jgi:ribosomal protein S18 acetylase RimI-like enzyme
MSLEIDLGAVRRLEERAFRGWPALETRDVAGWRLRFAGGYTKRANSINALGRDSQSQPETLSGLETAYRQRGLPPVWRLTPLAPTAVRERLVEPAYRTIERSFVQVAPIHAGFAADPDVGIEPRPSARWIEAFAKHSPVAPQHRTTMRQMLLAIPTAGFALVEQSGEPMAMAIGVLDGDHMGLFDVLVMPQARRRGLARRITESLYAWARGEGARFAYLQVVATNTAALPLYAAQGFRTAYAYEYRGPSAP